MLSVMTVVGTLSRTSSQAVSRAPCRNGRVSSANTCVTLPLLGGGANHAERGAVAGRRQRAGVAVRQDPRVLRHDVGAEPAHRPAALDVFVVNRVGLPLERRLELLDRLAGLDAGGEGPLHPRDRPEQIHGRRPRRRHQIAQLVELDGELFRALRLALRMPERDAHRRRDANRRRAANHHRLDRARDFGGGLAVNVDFLARQLALIDHHDRVGLPFNRRQHQTIILRQ